MKILKTLTAACLIVSTLTQPVVHAADKFVVREIELRGLERISQGTVLNYLPIKVGDEFNDSRSSDIVRSLFKTGFFKDIQLSRDGEVLVVSVVERESIAKITITGNKAINSENLLTGLKQTGFAEGEVYDKSLLDRVEQELRRQYFSQGKYAVKIDSKVSRLDDKRVAIAIDISEGKTATIGQINIVGNKSFTDKELLKDFKLTTPTLISFFTKSDQYSRQKLGADLETLRSHYLDNGYINFNIDSTQVSITPDKSEIYITVNLTEGDKYTISAVKLAGDLIVPQEELFQQVTSLRGGTFSRKEVTQTTANITERLGDDGYAFANVNAVPDIDKTSKTVSLTYFIDPGKRVYVRRINFAGNTRTRDEVLRREMRQIEGGWIATQKVNRSKERLNRLGFFEEVNVETPAVPNIDDQVDVNFNVKERPSGNLMLGFGFSQNQGLIFNTNIQENNFLGSGNTVNFAFVNSSVNRRYLIGFTDPYWTVDGISLGFNLSYRETNAANANITRFDSTVASVGTNIGIPISEFQNLNFGLEYENTELNVPPSPQVCRNNPNAQDCQFDNQVIRDFIDSEGTFFNILRFNTSFAYDTRNRAILPDRGMLHKVRLEAGIPGGDILFYKVDYDGRLLLPLTDEYTLALKANVGYGDSYGDTDQLPFFENFYAGGPRTVRGFQENTLGPKDRDNRALGGNFKLIGNAELILPVPFAEDVKSLRFTGFFDAGNVFGYDLDGKAQSIDLGDLRYSTGLSGIWVSPFGVLSVSIAYTLNDQDKDKTQPFQFTFGTTF